MQPEINQAIRVAVDEALLGALRYFNSLALPEGDPSDIGLINDALVAK